MPEVSEVFRSDDQLNDVPVGDTSSQERCLPARSRYPRFLHCPRRVRSRGPSSVTGINYRSVVPRPVRILAEEFEVYARSPSLRNYCTRATVSVSRASAPLAYRLRLSPSVISLSQLHYLDEPGNAHYSQRFISASLCPSRCTPGRA